MASRSLPACRSMVESVKEWATLFMEVFFGVWRRNAIYTSPKNSDVKGFCHTKLQTVINEKPAVLAGFYTESDYSGLLSGAVGETRTRNITC